MFSFLILRGYQLCLGEQHLLLVIFPPHSLSLAYIHVCVHGQSKGKEEESYGNVDEYCRIGFQGCLVD